MMRRSSFKAAVLLAFAALASASALPAKPGLNLHDVNACESAGVVKTAKSQFKNSAYFCRWYLSGSKSVSFSPTINANQLKTGCMCLAGNVAFAAPKKVTTSPLACAPLKAALQQQELNFPLAQFCKIWNATPNRPSSPFASLSNPQDIYRACQCTAPATTNLKSSSVSVIASTPLPTDTASTEQANKNQQAASTSSSISTISPSAPATTSPAVLTTAPATKTTIRPADTTTNLPACYTAKPTGLLYLSVTDTSIPGLDSALLHAKYPSESRGAVLYAADEYPGNFSSDSSALVVGYDACNDRLYSAQPDGSLQYLALRRAKYPVNGKQPLMIDSCDKPGADSTCLDCSVDPVSMVVTCDGDAFAAADAGDGSGLYLAGPVRSGGKGMTLKAVPYSRLP